MATARAQEILERIRRRQATETPAPSPDLPEVTVPPYVTPPTTPSREELRALARSTARRHGIDEDLFDSIIEHESNYDPRAVSGRKAKGLGQLMDETAKSLGVRDPFNPADNLEGSATLVAQLLKKYQEPAIALAAYNAGEPAVDEYQGIPPFKETRAYVPDILARWQEKKGTRAAPAPAAAPAFSVPERAYAPSPVQTVAPMAPVPAGEAPTPRAAEILQKIQGRLGAPQGPSATFGRSVSRETFHAPRTLQRHPDTETVTGLTEAEESKRALAGAAELPEKLRQAMLLGPDYGGIPGSRRIAAGVVKQIAALPLLPAAVGAGAIENVQAEGLGPGLARTAVDVGLGVTGIPQIIEDIKDPRGFGGRLLEDPVEAAMPYLFAVGAVKGGKTLLEKGAAGTKYSAAELGGATIPPPTMAMRVAPESVKPGPRPEMGERRNIAEMRSRAGLRQKAQDIIDAHRRGEIGDAHLELAFGKKRAKEIRYGYASEAAPPPTDGLAGPRLSPELGGETTIARNLPGPGAAPTAEMAAESARIDALEKAVYKYLEKEGFGGRKAAINRQEMTRQIVDQLVEAGNFPREGETIAAFFERLMKEHEEAGGFSTEGIEPPAEGAESGVLGMPRRKQEPEGTVSWIEMDRYLQEHPDATGAEAFAALLAGKKKAAPPAQMELPTGTLRVEPKAEIGAKELELRKQRGIPEGAEGELPLFQATAEREAVARQGTLPGTEPAAPKKAAPATFLGEQEMPGGKPPVELYNLTEDIPGHSKGSTVSRQTLEKAGYVVERGRTPRAPERRGAPIQQPTGARDLEFLPEGGVKEGPLKTGEILWPEGGELKRGKYEGQVPGPADSVILRVRDAEGNLRHFQVREGETRVLVQPKPKPEILADEGPLSVDQRADTFRRAKQTVAEQGGTPEELAKLTGEQAVRLSELPKEEAARAARDILEQMRGKKAPDTPGASTPLQVPPTERRLTGRIEGPTPLPKEIKQRGGACYPLAARKLLEFAKQGDPKSGRYVIGEIQTPQGPVDHAWTVKGNRVWEPEYDRWWDKDTFYKSHQAKEYGNYSLAEMMQFREKTGYLPDPVTAGIKTPEQMDPRALPKKREELGPPEGGGGTIGEPIGAPAAPAVGSPSVQLPPGKKPPTPSTPSQAMPPGMQQARIPGGPKGKAPLWEGARPVNPHDVRRYLEKHLTAPIRKLTREQGKGAFSGYYQLHSEEIRVRRLDRLTTIAHEIGHYLDDVLGLNVAQKLGYRAQKNLTAAQKALRKELREAGVRLYGTRRPAAGYEAEGVAEFHKFLVNDPARAAAEFPLYAAEFEKRLKANPFVRDVLNEARNMVAQIEKQDALTRVMSRIRSRSEMQKKRTLDDTLTALYDDLLPLRRFDEALKKLDPTSAIRSYDWAYKARNWSALAEEILNHRMVAPGGGDAGPGFKQILKEVKNHMDELDALLAARSTLDRLQLGKETGITGPEAVGAIDLLKTSDPARWKKIEAAADALYKLEDQMLDLAVHYKIVSPESRAAMQKAHPFHTPMYRLMEEAAEGAAGTGELAGLFKRTAKKGSEREIFSPTENIVKNIYGLAYRIGQQQVRMELLKAARTVKGAGRFVSEVPLPELAETVPFKNALEQLAREIPEIKQVVDYLPLDALQGSVLAMRPSVQAAAAKGHVIVSQGGTKPVALEIHPEGLRQAILGLNKEEIPAFARGIAAVTAVMRSGYTIVNPEFAPVNFVRDQITALLNSDYGFVPLVSPMVSIPHIAWNHPTWKEFRTEGAQRYTLMNIDRRYLNGGIAKAIAGTPIPRHFGKVRRLQDGMKSSIRLVGTPFRAIAEVNQWAEALTRYSEFRISRGHGLIRKGRQALGLPQDSPLAEKLLGLKRAGADVLTASRAAQEVTVNFQRVGAQMRALSAMSAFYRANVNALGRTGRVVKEHPTRTMARAAIGIGIPAAYLYAANADDPQYRAIPPYLRDLFFFIKIGDKEWIRIRKPDLAGVLVGGAVEHGLDWYRKNDPSGFKDWKWTMLNDAAPGFYGLPFPSPITPIVELATNISSYTGAPIVPEHKRKLLPELQTRPGTGPTAIAIAKKTGAPAALLEHLAQSAAGTTGTAGLRLADIAGTAAGVFEQPTKESGRIPPYAAAQTPILRRFTYQLPEEYEKQAKARETYDLRRRGETLLSSLREIMRTGTEKDKAEFVKKYGKELDKYLAIKPELDRELRLAKPRKKPIKLHEAREALEQGEENP